MVFIGPSPEAMRKLGDRIEAKLLAESTGIPVVAWGGGPAYSFEEATRHAGTIGYPLIAKVRSGGGPRSSRIVTSAGELEQALELTQTEAPLTFGDPDVFLERLLVGARHLEVQSSQTTTAPCGRPECAIAPSSGAIRSWSRNPVLKH